MRAPTQQRVTCRKHFQLPLTARRACCVRFQRPRSRSERALRLTVPRDERRSRCGGRRDGTRHVPASTLGLVVDFMCFAVRNHAYKMKYYVVRNLTLTKVLSPNSWRCLGR